MELTIEAISFVLLAICILGRTWCSLYISGRKIRDLVDYGPYSITRNPLYFFTFLGAVGVGLQMDSVLFGLTVGILTFVVFSVVVRHEEAALTVAHGSSYTDYRARVPRFMPRLRQWTSVSRLEVQPHLVVRTFFDSLLFLLAGPVVQAIIAIRKSADLPVLVLLP
ncbi:methyltransferase family protein [Phyllobacterium salinisoli]|uniref:methyltransferase family protein n=1 Tax=Phyllobacterium salinisoli TaxID=1899321 RepID=UPI0013597950|nr:isoprenylcysteine carboxylmethyltransferase family protein [Phyllobacterium salinisoli]